MDESINLSENIEYISRAQMVVFHYLNACIKAFPDMNAVEAFAVENGFQPMPEQAARAKISGLPGQGWMLGEAGAADRIELIIEYPPNSACAIWAYDGDAGAYHLNAQLLLLTFVAAQDGMSTKSLADLLPPAPAHIHPISYLLSGPGLYGVNAALILVNTSPEGNFRARLSRTIR